ncbi:MAG: inorganic phosphate transporter [Candidatus Firestonebacteria bacterium]
MEALIILIIVALIFDYLNGFHDSSNIIATIVSSRAISVQSALVLASVAELIGPFLLGTAVAKTIGNDIIVPGCINLKVILAALSGAIIWNLITWSFGLPSSSSHALIGGLVGAVCISSGIGKINLNGILKVVLILFSSPIIGFLIGFVFTKILHKLTVKATPKINNVFKSLQVVSSTFLALSHGGNDAQKTMGIITMGLVMLKIQNNFVVPTWVIFICAIALALGIASGGLKIAKTVGTKIFKIRPMHGFSVQFSSSLVILAAALIGGPVSTTHIVSSSVVGVGSSISLSKVRWTVVTDILLAWVLTLPLSAIIAGLSYKMINLIR